jgi:hypothetical protein
MSLVRLCGCLWPNAMWRNTVAMAEYIMEAELSAPL